MNNKYLKGMAIGSMIGIAAGMLLMPQMGNDIRNRLMNGGKSVMDSANNMMSKIGNK